MLSFTTLALTVAEADAYAVARGLSDWTGDTATKTAALRRGQDYIAGKYNQLWLVSFDNDAAPDQVKYAITEAACREIKVPFSLTPDYTAGQSKVLTEVKGIKWEVIGDASAPGAMLPTISAIEYLLTGIASVGSMSGFPAVMLA
ncbi:MAG: hypothetical protein U5N55_10675 [Cypionkella sp.]|nr:hypothetical protein [Cypionkella sp.]